MGRQILVLLVLFVLAGCASVPTFEKNLEGNLFESEAKAYTVTFPELNNVKQLEHEQDGELYEYVKFHGEQEAFPEGEYELEFVYDAEGRKPAQLNFVVDYFLDADRYMTYEADGVRIEYIVNNFNELAAHYMIGKVYDEASERKIAFEAKMSTGNHSLTNDELTVFRMEILSILKTVEFSEE